MVGTVDLVEAERDVKMGLDVEPGNADLAALLKRVKLLLKQQGKKEAALYSKVSRCLCFGERKKEEIMCRSGCSKSYGWLLLTSPIIPLSS
jgi:hypothetical protein